MALITRLSRLLQADIHAVLDRLEEPASLLRQAIREMEEILVNDERILEQMHREHNQGRLREQELQHAQSALEEKLDVCLSQGNEALARTLVRKKLELEQQGRFLGNKASELDDRIAELTSTVTERRGQLKGLHQKADLLIEGGLSNEHPGEWRSSDFSVDDAEVEIALLHEKQRRCPS